MPANTYGVDETTIRTYYPTAIPFTAGARVDADLVTTWVARVAEDVRAAVYGAGVHDDASITDVSAPIAYAWLSQTVAVGAAYRVGEVAGHVESETLERWRLDFESRKERVMRWPKTVLSDLSLFRARAGAVSLER